MTDNAIEAACKEMHKPDPIDEANPYVIAIGWDQFNEKYKKQYRELMRAAIAAHEQAMWRPIEEAPKDGTLFLVWCPSYAGLPSMFSLCAWHPDAGFCVDELREPTHYRPLPPPPGTPATLETDLRARTVS